MEESRQVKRVPSRRRRPKSFPASPKVSKSDQERFDAYLLEGRLKEMEHYITNTLGDLGYPSDVKKLHTRLTKEHPESRKEVRRHQRAHALLIASERLRELRGLKRVERWPAAIECATEFGVYSGYGLGHVVRSLDHREERQEGPREKARLQRLFRADAQRKAEEVWKRHLGWQKSDVASQITPKLNSERKSKRKLTSKTVARLIKRPAWAKSEEASSPKRVGELS